MQRHLAARWTNRRAAARTILPPNGGWPCLRPRVPFQFAGRESGFWEALNRSANASQRRSLAMLVTIVSSARAFRRHHQRSHRLFRRALLSEQLALRRLQHALQNFAALRRFWIRHANSRDLEALFGIPLRRPVADLER